MPEIIKKIGEVTKKIGRKIYAKRWFLIGIATGLLIQQLLAHPSLLFYMIRWQLSTPSLAIISVLYLAHKRHQKMKWPTADEWVATFYANLAGSLVFYKVDEWIFLIVKKWIN